MLAFRRTCPSVSTSVPNPCRTAWPNGRRSRARSGVTRNSGSENSTNQTATTGPTTRTCSACASSSPNGGGLGWTNTTRIRPSATIPAA